MQSLGGRPARRSGAIVLALALLLGACGDGGREVTSDDERARARDEATATTRDDDGDRGDGEVRSGRTSTTTTTTTAPARSTTTTAAPPPTAPPTTAPAPPPTTAPPPPPTTAAPPPPPPSGPRYGTRNTGCEQYMYGQINGARSRVGRPALTFDTGIQHIALDWSDEMSRTQTLRHNPSYGDQILRHRNYRTAGENVGRGYEQGSLFQAFMDSPGHRANIESDAYSHVTVGCLTDGSGQLWVTQNFWGG